MAEETVNVNPDGSTTFEGGEESTMPPVEDAGAEGGLPEAGGGGGRARAAGAGPCARESGSGYAGPSGHAGQCGAMAASARQTTSARKGLRRITPAQHSRSSHKNPVTS